MKHLVPWLLPLEDFWDPSTLSFHLHGYFPSYRVAAALLPISLALSYHHQFTLCNADREHFLRHTVDKATPLSPALGIRLKPLSTAWKASFLWLQPSLPAVSTFSSPMGLPASRCPAPLRRSSSYDLCIHWSQMGCSFLWVRNLSHTLPHDPVPQESVKLPDFLGREALWAGLCCSLSPSSPQSLTHQQQSEDIP